MGERGWLVPDTEPSSLSRMVRVSRGPRVTDPAKTTARLVLASRKCSSQRS